MKQAKKVLVIDDSSLIRLQVKHMLEQQGFVVLGLENADDYFSSIWQYNDIDLILLDINLPGTDGIALLKAMKEKQSKVWPPVIILSGTCDKVTVQNALLLGAEDYIIKPLIETDLIQRVEQRFMSAPCASRSLLQRYCELVQRMKKVFEAVRHFKKLPMDMITELTNECAKMASSDEIMLILFSRETSIAEYIYQHMVNVGVLSGVIGKWVGLKEEYLHDLVLAGLLHDIGKTQIPREILDKPGALISDEIDIVRTHPSISYEMIKTEDFSENVLLGVSQHHERMDGSGYPYNLPGKEICLTARIVAVADVYDAMTSNKVYSQAEMPFTVMEELFREIFGLLDPHICTVFLKNVKKCLVGQLVRLSDGSKAKVAYFGEQGFAEPVLQINNGKCIELSENLNIVEFVKEN